MALITINSYHIAEDRLVGEVYENVANYDLLSSIMICLGTKEDERYTGLLKLLDIWLSGNSIDEKRAALKDIFDADMPARLLEYNYRKLVAELEAHPAS